MASLDDLGITVDDVRRMYEEWTQGAKKSALERKYLNKPESHGKLFTSLVREHLGIETEKSSTMSAHVHSLEAEVRRLRSLLTRHGIDPDDD